MNVFIVLLEYAVHFDDADDGDCYAGNGARVLKVFGFKYLAEEFVATWQPVITAAEKETTVFPVQANNRKLKNCLGFKLSDFGQGEEQYKLTIQEMEVTT